MVWCWSWVTSLTNPGPISPGNDIAVIWGRTQTPLSLWHRVTKMCSQTRAVMKINPTTTLCLPCGLMCVRVRSLIKSTRENERNRKIVFRRNSSLITSGSLVNYLAICRWDWMGCSRQFLPEGGVLGADSKGWPRDSNQKVLAGLSIQDPKPGIPPEHVSLLG